VLNRKQKIKRVVGVIGVAFTIIGWAISNTDHFPIGLRIFAPKYSNSISAFSRMHEKNFILGKGETGFLEISEILKGHISGNEIPIITQIKTLNWGSGMWDMPEGLKTRDYIGLEVSFSNGPSLTAEFYELRSEIKERYYSHNLFLWGCLMFGLGVLIDLFAIFL